ncbi:MAG: N-acetyl-alpha-D-glucosaminyl L-malate synthase BshA, partial [Terriglobia bacterium]
MKIGITCYPTYGGSGVVGTELGMELAERGHEVHFIASSLPFRLRRSNHRVMFHEVEVMNYPLFEFPPYDLALATKMGEVAQSEGLDLLHVHYAIPHSVSAFLARSMLAPKRLPFITTLHGTDITLVGINSSYWGITRFAITQSDGVTAISRDLQQRTFQEFEIQTNIEVIHNFVNCEKYCRRENEEYRHEFAPEGERILAHLSNFRPVKRVTDVVEIFARVRQKVPSKLLLIGDG